MEHRFKIAFIPNLMTNWKKYKLSQITEIIGGGTPKTSVAEYWNGNIPWLSVFDFAGDKKKVYQTEKTITEAGLKNSSTKILKKGQLIISARGTVGELAMLGRDMAFNQSCYGLNAISEIAINDFLYYLLKYEIDSLKAVTHGSVFDTITRQTFEQIEVNIPEDINEQQRIASILSSLDDKIELNRRMNQTLEQIAATLFKKYFVDDIDPDNLPEGWRWGKLIELCRNFDSKRIPLSSRQREEKKGIYPYYGAASIMDYVDDYLFDGLYILLGEDGTVVDEKGFPVLQYAWGRFWVNNHAHVLQGKGISTNHLYMILKNSPIAHLVTGAVQPKISQGNLNSLQVLIPSKETNSKFDTEINSLFSLIRNNSEQIRTLQKTRDSLLPKLMSGEIDVTAINQNEPLNEEVLI
ncbi:restriction endonuclease subunit S [Parafilimonas sp.]|uniref:restriction endonuclease subunit S n=1 Tax=Parafilimonas sp. TaxID=1969739 RepID=UPI003F7EE483